MDDYEDGINDENIFDQDIGSALNLGRECPYTIRDIVEAIDQEKHKIYRPELSEKERKREIKRLKLDDFD